MSILVDNKLIEVKLHYVDRQYPGGAVGTKVFKNKEEEEDWVNRENLRRSEKVADLKAMKKEIPPHLEKNAKDEIKELITYWKRTDWGTQSEILDACSIIGENGEQKTNYSKYRALQMQKLMSDWNVKSSDGSTVPINQEVISRLDLNIALALITKYESLVNPSQEEMENFE